MAVGLWTAFDGFGNRTASLGSTDLRAGYGAQWGYLYDAETGLSLCTNRFYDSANGRWLTRDPFSYAGGINLYGYCANNGVNAADPSGLDVADGPPFKRLPFPPRFNPGWPTPHPEPKTPYFPLPLPPPDGPQNPFQPQPAPPPIINWPLLMPHPGTPGQPPKKGTVPITYGFKIEQQAGGYSGGTIHGGYGNWGFDVIFGGNKPIGYSVTYSITVRR